MGETNKPTEDIVCPYKDLCRSYPRMCGSCANNTADKRDYYVPRNSWTCNPWITPWPYVNPWPGTVNPPYIPPYTTN